LTEEAVSNRSIEHAIDALRKLPPGRQEELADFICELAEAGPETIQAAYLPAVLEGLAQMERGEFASDDEVEAAFRSFTE
jgi:nitrate reductase assembly molybdenum cofactor insertion protein NarJ